MKRLRAAVLISGNGSNLQAIIDHIEKHATPCDIQVVVSNDPAAYGLKRAAEAGIETVVVDHREFASRQAFDKRLGEVIAARGCDIILLAGFMRILTDDFVERFEGRMVNIHPSLLPDLKGLDTHRRAIEEGREFHGASVHFVTSELDSGPVIVRGRLRVAAEDTPESLKKRVHELEHRIYPLALEWLAERRLRLEGDTVYLDDRALPPQGEECLDDSV